MSKNNNSASFEENPLESLQSTPTNFFSDGPDDSTDVFECVVAVTNMLDPALIPDFPLPTPKSTGDAALLDWIFSQITPERAGSGPFAAALLLATCKSAINQEGVGRYAQLLTQVADKVSDYTRVSMP